MKQAFSIILFLLIAVCRSDAAGKPNLEETKANWASLLASFTANDPLRAQSFVGKTVRAEGGRQTDQPPLRLSHNLPNERILIISVTKTFPSKRVEREVSNVLKWKAVFVSAQITGTVRSVNVNKREIVIEPVSAEVTSAN
jgi:hypothetical protein